MITKLHLENFKNFKSADLELGEFTTLFGRNATGKSNIGDALRFLHGIGCGYSLPEIFGKRGQWSGIRGGSRNVTRYGASDFSLTATFDDNSVYYIKVKTDFTDGIARVVEESLAAPHCLYKTVGSNEKSVEVSFPVEGHAEKGFQKEFDPTIPVITQIWNAQLDFVTEHNNTELIVGVKNKLKQLTSMRFFDFQPEVLRQPAEAGQKVLGDHGEGLSAVLQDVCRDQDNKKDLIFWLNQLLPIEVTELEFAAFPTGEVMVIIVEKDSKRTLAASASEGTLRLLALLAVFFSSQPQQLLFFENLETNLHPVWLYTVLHIIKENVSLVPSQIMLITQSAQLLNFYREKEIEYLTMLYRREKETDTEIKRAKDFDHFDDVYQSTALGDLFDSGWFETTMAFDQEPEAIEDYEDTEIVAAR